MTKFQVFFAFSKKNSHSEIVDADNKRVEFVFNNRIVFYHKKRILDAFKNVSENNTLVLNLEKTTFIGYDIKEMFQEIQETSIDRGIKLQISHESTLKISP